MMRKNRKKHNKNVHYDWNDRPDDPEKTLTQMSEDEIKERFEDLFGRPMEDGRKQRIVIRCLRDNGFWGMDNDFGLDNLKDYTVILLLTESYEVDYMWELAADMLLRNCRDFARCTPQNDEWRTIIGMKFKEIDDISGICPNVWRIESKEDIQDILWICKDNVLIICSGMEMMDYICDKFELSKYILEDMEKRMEMTWGEWQIQQDRNMSWHSELDWWGDPMHCKLTYEDLDFLEYHESEWVHYINKSRQRELDSRYRKISVIGKYCSNGYRLLICDKFPSCIATQYIHTGDKAYMSLDGEHHHGFMIYQSEPEEVFEDIRTWGNMPKEFTLVKLRTKKDLSQIKNIYFV